ncbi:MAG: hypothetical protein DRJ37_00745 [Thermoprotei archaeon]|nr:MAG: hypothetical protein DRJ37_00745 [Thermoprotei archaeon]
MDIIIRGINEKIYREFKAEAARRGLKIREAITEAIKLWLAINELPLLAENRDSVFYLLNKRELEEKYYGKYIAIRDGRVIVDAENLEELVLKLRKMGVNKALVIRPGFEEEGFGGEWSWSSIG